MLGYMYYRACLPLHESNISLNDSVTILSMVTIMYGKQWERNVTVNVATNISKHSFSVKIHTDHALIVMAFQIGKFDHYCSGSILSVQLLGVWEGIFLLMR